MNNYMTTYTWVYLQLYEWFYESLYIQRKLFDAYNYNFWICSIKLVFILGYTHNYTSSYTIIELM